MRKSHDKTLLLHVYSPEEVSRLKTVLQKQTTRGNKNWKNPYSMVVLMVRERTTYIDMFSSKMTRSSVGIRNLDIWSKSAKLSRVSVVYSSFMCLFGLCSNWKGKLANSETSSNHQKVSRITHLSNVVVGENRIFKLIKENSYKNLMK